MRASPTPTPGCALSDEPKTTFTVLHKFPDRSMRVEVVDAIPKRGDERIFADGTENTVLDVKKQKNGQFAITWKNAPSYAPKGGGGRRRR